MNSNWLLVNGTDFHSPGNRRRLDEMLELNVLPAKGYLSQANRKREQAPEFVAARQQHPAVESAVNNLEHRGLGRVRCHGADGFERMVALSILAANLHRLGWLLQRQERARIRRRKKSTFARCLKPRRRHRFVPNPLRLARGGTVLSVKPHISAKKNESLAI